MSQQNYKKYYHKNIFLSNNFPYKGIKKSKILKNMGFFNFFLLDVDI